MSKQEAAACLSMILLIDDDEEKVTRGPIKKLDVEKGHGRSILEPSTGINGGGYANLQRNYENEL